MSIRLSGHDRKAIAARIKADIDEYCKVVYDDGPRDHLGASVISNSCNRALVYAFRWMHREQFDGRMQRLFNRGHLQEPRFVEWLRGIGSNVAELAPTGKQWRMTNLENHYGGSLDGQIILPERYKISDTLLLEMKSHNDRRFKEVVKKGVIAAKPDHFMQMCAYGEAYELEYGLYMAINKNDDDVWPEIVQLDRALGVKLRDKAKHVIGALELPPRVAASPAYETCKYCPHSGVCHLGQPVDVNCRSCANSKPVADGQWFCQHWNAIIPHDEIPKACEQWSEFK